MVKKIGNGEQVEQGRGGEVKIAKGRDMSKIGD